MFSSLVLRLDGLPQRTLTVVHDWLFSVMADAVASDGFADDVREEVLGGLEHFERLAEASSHPQDPEIRAYLLGATVGVFPAPLHEAAGAGCPRVSRLLVARGLGVDSCGEDLVTPLYLAAKSGHLEVGRALLAAGADVNFRGPGQRTPLFAAISSKSVPFVELLLGSGARLDVFACVAVQPHPGLCLISPLIHSILEGDADVTQRLMDAGAAAAAATPRAGATAAHFAAMCANVKALRLLLAGGADAGARDRDGNNPAHYLVRGAMANTGAIVATRSLAPLYATVLRALVDATGVAAVAARNRSGLTPLGLLTLRAGESAEEAARFKDWAPLAVEFSIQGAYEWGVVPEWCPGLGRALVPVWEAAPEQAGPLFRRLAPWLKPVARTALLALRRRLGTQELVMRVLGVVMDQAEEGAADG